MSQNCTAIVDIGKTNAKLTLWDPLGRLIAQVSRANHRPAAPIGDERCRVLDVGGIDEWLMDSLSVMSRQGAIRQIIPVGHGAAVVLLRNGREYLPPLDYEEPIPGDEKARYSAQRNPFRLTGSPQLPNGLNLGLQLHHIEQLTGSLPDDVKILLWPQYWAWRLCGEMATEVSSLGCHSDLWFPVEARFSDLAIRRGWVAHMPPIMPAAMPLGPVRPEIARATGIPPKCEVFCGLHDSNAALLAARGHTELGRNEATVLSTGTWFIAMRTLGRNTRLESIDLDEHRDCLVNVDVHGHATPSARFMGGREAELIGSLGAFDIRAPYDPETLMRRLPGLVRERAFINPTLIPGVGPYPAADGRWQNQPFDPEGQRAVASLYLALMADVSLDMIGSCDRLLVDGRYATDPIFVRALATLRPEQSVLVASAQHDIAYGALRLVDHNLKPQCNVCRVNPLDINLDDYATEWRAQASRSLSLAEASE